MTYLQFSTGFKGGGVNPRCQQNGAPRQRTDDPY